MKFKSKSLISIILSIMMVISMILVAIPANAAVVDSEPVGSGEYYLWYGIGVDNPGNIKTKVQLTTNDSVTYEGTADFDAGTSTWNKIYLNQSDSNAYTSPVWTDASFTCTISDDITDKVDSASPGTYYYNETNLGMFTLNLKSGAGAVSIKFSYNKSTKKMTISAGGTEPTVATTETTVATTTTPATGEWFLIGGGGPSDNIFGDYSIDNTAYPLSGTGTVLSRSVSFANGKTYFRFHNKTKQYSLSNTSEEEIGDANNKKQLVESSAKALIFNNATGSDQTVNICLDTSTNQVWYESATEPTTTEPVETTVPPTTVPVGDYTITDKTELNGSLSFSAEGRTAGRANKGDTVTITGKPAYSYFELDTVTVTGDDKTNIEVSVTGNTRTFTMPAQNVTAKATFKLNKSAYIQSLKEDGLWIDVAPDQYDTTATLIKWNNYTGSNHSTNGYYTFYVPKNVDLTNAKVYNGYDTAVVLNNVTIPANSCNTETLNIPVSDTNYTTFGGTTSPVKVMQGSTNAMFLTTSKDLPTQTDSTLTSKDKVEYLGGSCKTMTNDTATPEFSSALKIDTVKGRGNSSWEASYKLFGKYAFNMKLASKTNLFGMDSAESKGAKSWCLLANNADESMMRNALTYQLAAEIGIQDSPEFRFVDIYDNGEYLGSYLVTEKVDVGNSKLVKGKSFDDLNEDGAKAEGAKEVSENTEKSTYSYGDKTYSMQYAKVSPNNDTSDSTKYPFETKGKYLLEFEIKNRLFPNGLSKTSSEASWFQSPQGQYVVVKSPEFATKEQVEFIATKFAAMEAMIFTSDNTSTAKKSELSTVMDVESFAKMYLIQEFSSNLDSAATSYYMTFDCAQSDPVFVANPVWDYDWAYGQYMKDEKESVTGSGVTSPLDTDNPQAWYAKTKKLGDDELDKYSIQSQLATNNSDFKSVVRKVWEETNGFYDKIQTYYATNGQIDTWYSQIKDSVNMNETRWGFIANDPLIKGVSGNGSDGWGSKNTGDNHEAAVKYLKTDWTATRAVWLNEQFTTTSEYTTYTPDVPTIKLYAADGKTEISTVEQGTGFIIKVTSPLENNVVYRFFKSDGLQVGSDQSDGILEIATDDLTVGETYTYKVQAVYKGNASADSATVSVTIDDKAGNKQVTIYFKSASASAYVPSLSIDGAAAAVMKRDAKTAGSNGTYFGSTYSGSLKFYWFYTIIKLDTSVEHTLKFTTKDNRVNASTSYKFVANEGNNYYFAVDNLMGDTNLVYLTGEKEYIRNYHISATHMVHSTTYDNNVGFTWINGKEWAMGTYIKDHVNTASLTDLTSSSLLTIPSALTPNAMLEASSAPAFFTIKSATLAQRISAEAEEVSTLQYQLLDVNLDGKVDVKDSTMMQKALAGF